VKDLSNIKYVYFLGIGGIGMSALARYFNACGKVVVGYDKTSTPLTDELKSEGIKIHFNDDVDAIPEAVKQVEDKEAVLVVLTPAIPKAHAEWNYFISNGYTIVKRSQLLGLLTADQETMAVAGTHGKTTTSSILAFILSTAKENCTAFLGGISSNFNSNLLLGNANEKNHLIVVEADEFDRSFLTLFPKYAIITSMDPDHLDIYGTDAEIKATYQKFAEQVKRDGLILIKKGLPIKNTEAKILTYSIDDSQADYFAENIMVKEGFYYFDLVTPGYKIEKLKLGLPGRHNVENALAASALAIEVGIDLSSIQEALLNYKGVKRRFEVQVRNENITYIDDYAHHPTELVAAIQSAKELYPGKKITGLFQPHLFTRTRDFADGFASALSMLDTIYLLDIYPAREEPIAGIDSNMLLGKITNQDKMLVSKTAFIEQIRSRKPEVLMTLGAGDVDQLVNPLVQLLKEF